MKFVKGIMLGTLVTAGLAVMYKETKGMSKRKMVRKGKQFAKKMGIL